MDFEKKLKVSKFQPNQLVVFKRVQSNVLKYISAQLWGQVR